MSPKDLIAGFRAAEWRSEEDIDRFVESVENLSVEDIDKLLEICATRAGTPDQQLFRLVALEKLIGTVDEKTLFSSYVRALRTADLSDEPACGGHRPSGDVLLESVAKSYGRGSVAAILTGMGRDGAIGMKAIKQCQGKTIAQNEKSCVVFGMPLAAVEMNAIDKVLPLERIAEEIVGMVR